MKTTRRAVSLAACALGLISCASTPEPTPPRAAEGPQIEASEAASPTAARADVETLEFQVEIAAPVETVWETMLSPAGYTEWTKPFLAGSYFEGDWSEGATMHFLAPGGSGMVALIEQNRPHEFLSIKHLGFVVNGIEDTTSASVRTWAPAYENYRLAETPGGTRVTVEHEVLSNFEPMMSSVWPRALAALKQLCEAQ